MKHVPQLDGIRGLAIVAVLAVHVSLFLMGGSLHRPLIYLACRLMIGGWLGVDVFFVLSGFLITSILLSEHGQSHFWSRFYLRRGMRILPVFLVVFAIVLVAIHFVAPATLPSATVLLSTLLFAGNWLILAHTSMPMLPQLWSLAVEEQFYLVWPQFAGRMRATTVLKIALGAAVAEQGLRVALVAWHVDPDILYRITPTRIDGLAVGAALAAALTLPRAKQWLATYSRGILGGAAVFFAGTLIAFHGVLNLEADPRTMIFAIPGVVVLTAMLIYEAVTATLPRVLAGALSIPALRYLGRRSYALYLIHYPIMEVLWRSRAQGFLFTMPHSFTFDVLITCAALALSIVATEVSWRVIEAPSLRLRRVLEARLIAAPETIAR